VSTPIARSCETPPTSSCGTFGRSSARAPDRPGVRSGDPTARKRVNIVAAIVTFMQRDAIFYKG
jgi:hypothetical protein